MFIVFQQKGTGTRQHAWGPYTKDEAATCMSRLRKDGRLRAWEAEVVASLPDVPHLPYGARPAATDVEKVVAEFAQLSDAEQKGVLHG